MKNSNFSISLNAPAINSIFSGIIFLQDETINGTINTIFLTSSTQKPIPINIATNVVGYFDDVAFVSNLNQARQYLGLERINNQELNNKLAIKSEEIKNTKKNNLQNQKIVKNKTRKKTNNSSETQTTEEENVTIENEVIEETQIIEVDKPTEIQSNKSEVKQNDNNSNNNLQKSSKLLPPSPQNSKPSQSENENIAQPSI